MNQAETIDQVDLFAELPDEEKPAVVKTKKQVEEEEKNAKRAATVAKRTPSAAQQEKEPDEYDVDRQVWYAGQRIDVPSRTMKLEDVRAWLEETYFPELTKERCEMVYDKDKAAVIPVLKGHRKGAKAMTVHLETPENAPPVYFLLDDRGLVWEVRRTQTGEFRVPVVGKGTKCVGYQLNLFVPKIPLSCLEAILTRFKSEPDIEHLAFVIWEKDIGYSVYWPEQTANQVTVESDGFMETEERFIVAHIHSHGKINAFFSQTDDADEIRTGLYGVIGEVTESKPTLRFRYSCGGNFVNIDPQAIFAENIKKLVRT